MNTKHNDLIFSTVLNRLQTLLIVERIEKFFVFINLHRPLSFLLLNQESLLLGLLLNKMLHFAFYVLTFLRPDQ